MRFIPKVAFKHIPKTGGSSLIKGVQCDKQILRYGRPIPDIKASFVASHYGMDSFDCITLIRDPVEMFYSFYNHFKSSQFPFFTGRLLYQVDLARRSSSIGEYLERGGELFPKGWFEFDNVYKVFKITMDREIYDFMKSKGIEYKPCMRNVRQWEYDSNKENVTKLLAEEIEITNRIRLG